MAGKGTNPPSKARGKGTPMTNPKATLAQDVMNPPGSRPAPKPRAARPAPTPKGPPIEGWKAPDNTRGLEIANSGREALQRNLNSLRNGTPGAGNRFMPQPTTPSAAPRPGMSMGARVGAGAGALGVAAAAAPTIGELIRRLYNSDPLGRPTSPHAEAIGNRGQPQAPAGPDESMARGHQVHRDYDPEPRPARAPRFDETAQANMRRESRPAPRPAVSSQPSMSDLLNRAQLSAEGRKFVMNEAPGIRDEAELRRRLGEFSPENGMARGGMVGKYAQGGDVKSKNSRWDPAVKDYFDTMERTETRIRQEEADRRADEDFNENGRSTKSTFKVRGRTMTPRKMAKGGDVSGSFSDAFKRARAAGEAEFTWNGKRYHTKTKEEMGGRSETVRPTAKPSAAARATAEAKRSGSTDDYVDTSKPIDRASALREADRVSRGAVKMAKGGMVGCGDKPKKMAKGGLAGSFDMPGMSDTPGRAPQNRRPKTMKSGAKPKIKATMKAKNNMPLPKMARGGMSKKGK